MLLDCSQCGAPLDVEQNAWIATCCYCAHANNVRRSIHKRPDDWRQTPPGWQPPAQWTPPPQAPALSVPLRYNPIVAKRKMMAGGTAVLITVVLGLTGAGAALFSALAPSSRSSAAPLPISEGSGAWDGQAALECRGVTKLQGLEVQAQASPAIVLYPGCKLTIDNCTVSAKQLFQEESGLGIVTLRNSKLTFEGGLSLSGNRSMFINGSTLTVTPKSGAKVFETTGNGSITMTNTEVTVTPPSGEVTFASCLGNGCVKMNNGTLTIPSGGGTVVLFDTRGNGSGTMKNVTVNAGGRPLAMRTSRPAKLEGLSLNGSSLVAEKAPRAR